jgi:2-dehydropantoate 2-reductase
MPDPERPALWIVGAGAVGLYLAARLDAVADVTLVARGERARALRARGVRVTGRESTEARVRVAAIEERPRVPAGVTALVCTKAPAMLEAMRSFDRTSESALGLCQNGLGVAAMAERAAPEAPLVRVACWFGASQTGPTEVSLAGMFQLELAAEGAAATRAADSLEGLLVAAGLPVSRASSIAACEWRKSLWNLAVSGPCALLDARNGAVLDDPALRALAAELVAEAVTVARAEGVELEPEGSGAAAQMVFASTEKTRDNFNAMVHDLRRGAMTEMPWLNAEVARRAARARGAAQRDDRAPGRSGRAQGAHRPRSAERDVTRGDEAA